MKVQWGYLIVKDRKISFMKKSPLWMRFFSMSLLLMSVVILIMAMMSIIQMRNKENGIIQSNISNSIYYMDKNLNNTLSRISYQLSNQQTASKFYSIKHSAGDYRSKMREAVAAICNENSEIFAVFYSDNDGNCYSAGEIFGSINSQINTMNVYKSKESYTQSDGIWCYAQAGRRHSSLIWCKDIIYLDDNYNQIELGTILLYLDIKRLSSEFFYDNMQTSTVVCDSDGVIVISQEEDLISKTFSNVFKTIDGDIVNKGKKSYLYKKETSSINGWEIISYIDMNMTGRNAARTMTSSIFVAFLGLLAVVAISFVLSKRIGKPVEELLRYIRINHNGDITQTPESDADAGDIEKIRRAFEEMSHELRNNIESNYKMNLRLQEITIKAYESQMNPHFLFNTLYMIQMMNVLGEKENVTTITNYLGKLLRFNLDTRNEVKIAEEIENVKNYLKIMELRFKGRFNYKIMIPPELMECYTVKFMLQPLIENSVSHGFVHKKDMCEIVIMGQRIGNDIAIVVKDNGQGIEPEHLEKLNAKLKGEESDVGGIGVVNVHERIKLLYGKEYGIDIFSDYEKNTIVLVHIPISKTPKTEVVKLV